MQDANLPPPDVNADLAIAPQLPAIITLIRNEIFTIITAPTGSGKSLGIPAALAAAGFRVMISVPTRASVWSLVNIQRSRLTHAPWIPKGIALTDYVSYADSRDEHPRYNAHSKIIYVTSGHARKKVLSNFSPQGAYDWDFCDVLMVDEIHAGSVDNTVMLHLWSIAQQSGVGVPHLVLASATPIPLAIHPQPKLFAVSFRNFEVKRYYAPTSLLNNEHRAYQATVAKVAELHQQQPLLSVFDGRSFHNHILVFAPGSGEVRQLLEELEKVLKPLMNTVANFQLIPLYGALQENEIEAAISNVQTKNVRKIIIATNVAETSLTITDVGMVVDTMLEKIVDTSQSGGKRLLIKKISKDSAEQRAGRAGRTRPGECYRMCSENEYLALEPHREEEIRRVPIHGVVAELLNAGLDPKMALPALGAGKIDNTTKLLQQLQLVNEQNQITDCGRFATKTRLSVRNATFLWQWWKLNKPIYIGVIVAALIDCYGPYFYYGNRGPRKDSTEPPPPDPAVLFGAYYGEDDLETYLNLWADVVANASPRAQSDQAHYYPSRNDLKNYATARSLNNRNLSEFFEIVKHTVKVLRKERAEIVEGGAPSKVIVDNARPLLLQIYKDQLMVREGKIYHNYLNHTISNINRDSVLYLKKPVGVIVLAMHENGRGTDAAVSTNGFIDMGIVTEVDDQGTDITMHRRNFGREIRSSPSHRTTSPSPAAASGSSVGSKALTNALKMVNLNSTPKISLYQARTQALPTGASSTASSSGVQVALAPLPNPWVLLESLKPLPSMNLQQWTMMEPVIVSEPTTVLPSAEPAISAPILQVVNLSREYLRWKLSMKLRDLAGIDLSTWFLDQFLLPLKATDQIFSEVQTAVAPNNVVNTTMRAQLSDPKSWPAMAELVSRYLAHGTTDKDSHPIIQTNPVTGDIQVGSFHYQMSEYYYRLLFEQYPSTQILGSLMRYASIDYPLTTIHPQIKQWLVGSFYIEQELLATPFTAMNVVQTLPYYSWFPDTDKRLGSAGAWDTAVLASRSTLIILPPHPTVISTILPWLVKELTTLNHTGFAEVLIVAPIAADSLSAAFPGLITLTAVFPIDSLLFSSEQNLLANPLPYTAITIRTIATRTTPPTTLLPWLFPEDYLVQAMDALTTYGHAQAGKNHDIIVPAVQAQMTSRTLVQEYTRYQTIIVPLKERVMRECLAFKPGKDGDILTHTTYGLLENWLISLANDQSDPKVNTYNGGDPIFFLAAMNPAYPATAKLLELLQRSHTAYPDPLGLLTYCATLITAYLANPLAEDPPLITVEGNQMTVGKYTREFPKNRLAILLNKGTDLEVASMVLREACLMPRGRQYTQPLAITKYYVERCGVNLEAFATPINAQILAVNSDMWFCSLFPDVEGVFGSQGSFFNCWFKEARMTVYPPFIEDIVNKAAQHLAAMFDQGDNLFAIITVPDWIDAVFFPILMDSTYRKSTFVIKKFENYSEDLRGRMKINKVSDRVIIWNKGYPDVDYAALEQYVLNNHKNTVAHLNKFRGPGPSSKGK
jgi:HrpA-like RNA helicase